MKLGRPLSLKIPLQSRARVGVLIVPRTLQPHSIGRWDQVAEEACRVLAARKRVFRAASAAELSTPAWVVIGVPDVAALAEI